MSAHHGRLTRQRTDRSTRRRDRAAELAAKWRAKTDPPLDCLIGLDGEEDLAGYDRQETDYSLWSEVGRNTGQSMVEIELVDATTGLHDGMTWQLLPKNPVDRRPPEPQRPRPKARSKAPSLQQENEAFMRQLAAEPDYDGQDEEMLRLQQRARAMYPDAAREAGQHGAEPEEKRDLAARLALAALSHWLQSRDRREREERIAQEMTLARTRPNHPENHIHLPALPA